MVAAFLLVDLKFLLEAGAVHILLKALPYSQELSTMTGTREGRNVAKKQSGEGNTEERSWQ